MKNSIFKLTTIFAVHNAEKLQKVTVYMRYSTDGCTDGYGHTCARAHFPLNPPPFPHNIIVTPAWTVQLTLLTLDPWRPIPLHYSLSRPPGQKWHFHSYPEWTWYTGGCISQKISKWIITSMWLELEAETLDICTYWDVYLFMLAIYVYLFIRRMVGTNYLLTWHCELLFCYRFMEHSQSCCCKYVLYAVVCCLSAGPLM